MLKRLRWLLMVLAVGVVGLAFWSLQPLMPWKSKAQEHRPGPPPSSLSTADNTTPSGAVVGLAEALRTWDLGLAAQWMALAPQGPFTDAYHNVLAPALARMELEVGAERVEGDTAWVDVAVTAVDVGGALGNLGADAASYLAGCMISHSQADWSEFLEEYLFTASAEEMLRVRRDATAYLVRDSAGKWRIDANSPENREFCNALTGGLLDVLEQLEHLLV